MTEVGTSTRIRYIDAIGSVDVTVAQQTANGRSQARRWTVIGSKGATLELAVLGLLHDSPLHGYELRKRLNLLLGWTRLLSYGSLYPALKRMLRAGLVTEVAMASPGVSRRQRIVYQITPAGTEYFGAKITDVGPSAWEDEDFNMRFAFFSRTDSDVRLRILEGRRSRLQERLDRARRSRGPEGADRYVTELQRHAIESVEREVRWLTDLIAAERGAPAPQPDPGSPTTCRGRDDLPAGQEGVEDEGVTTRSTSHQQPHRPSVVSEEENPMGSVRVAIVGVGNCASSLVQGVEYYKDADPSGSVPGLMHVSFGDYHVSDVEFVAAFDVDAKKVGFDLSDAINNSENNTIRICDVPPTGVNVQRGPTLDGLGKYYLETIDQSDAEPVDVVQALKESRADVLVSYLPVGSEQADKFYAQCAIDAGVAFVNALPVFIASDPVWAKKFEDAGVPIIGDDIKSQVGATITHRVLARLFEERGVVLDRTYQLNVGGNMDFKNMLERDRLESKKISKTQAVTSNMSHDMGARNVHIGPSDYVQWLDDRKWAYVRLEGRAFGDVPLNMEYKLEVWDSPNSAGIIIDAIRAAKIAKDRGVGGPILSASSYLMKSPPVQRPDDEGRTSVEAFIKGDVER